MKETGRDESLKSPEKLLKTRDLEPPYFVIKGSFLNFGPHSAGYAYLTKPLVTETGAGEEFLKSAARTSATSAGNKGSAGRRRRMLEAGSIAIQATSRHSPCSGTGPGHPRSTVQEFLPSTCSRGQWLRNLHLWAAFWQCQKPDV